MNFVVDLWLVAKKIGECWKETEGKWELLVFTIKNENLELKIIPRHWDLNLITLIRDDYDVESACIELLSKSHTKTNKIMIKKSKLLGLHVLVLANHVKLWILLCLRAVL